MMNNALNYFIEANLYLVVFYLLYQILLARDKNFRFNRVFILSGVFLSIALPLFTFNLTTNAHSTGSFEGYIMLPAITISNVQSESVGFILKWWQVVGIIYLSGVGLYSLRLIWQMVQIFQHLPFLNSSRERKDGYTLVTTNGDIPTCSFFKFLFWDKSIKLTKEEKNQILEHELVHIRQWHSIDVLVVELLRTVFWFNPVIHLMKSRLTEVHEYLADQYATKKIGVESYSKLLTLQIFKSFDFSLSNNFHKSQITKRLHMLRSNRSGSTWINLALLVPSLALLITVLACDVTEEILPNITSSSLTPNIPQGWEIINENSVSKETKNMLFEMRNSIPDVELFVARTTTPDATVLPLIKAMNETMWGISKIFTHSNHKTAILRNKDSYPSMRETVIEEVIIPDDKSDSKEVFTIVENQPVPIGGILAFYEKIQSSMIYPKQARMMGIEGKVFVQFTVNENGILTDVKAVKGIGAGCDQEAVRVIQESDVWKPGEQRGRKVSVRMILPITFKLG